jgi:hypothetical protein
MKLKNRPEKVEEILLEWNISAQNWAWPIHELILNQGEVACDLRWSLPFYGFNKWQIYLNPLKAGGLECCFMNARFLPAAEATLFWRKRSRVAGLKFPEECQDPYVLLALIQETFIRDRGY